MAKSGASKGAKKINAFNDGKLEGVNVASDRHYPSDGPGSLLDRRDTDFIRYDRELRELKPGRGYESDRDGSIPLVKKTKKSKKRTA